MCPTLSVVSCNIFILADPKPMEKDDLVEKMKALHVNEGELRKRVADKRYSVVIGHSWLPDDYNKYVDESIMNVKFEIDVFQKQAFYFLSRACSVFVSAHTSSGKTLVAEYAISLSQLHGTRIIYTSPIKALSNQKYYDFKQKYDDVGIITGDVQVNPTAKCLVMTTEILRNLVYRGGDLLRDTEFVVFDEVHYINDPDRGVVWEECIIMLPKRVIFIMLSATIPNGLEFSEWVGRTKDRVVYVISTNKRAVPLEHVIYCDWDVYAIDDSRNMKRECPSNFKGALIPFSKKTKPTGRFKVLDLANFVVRKKLTPAIFFCFSKRKCEEHAELLRTLNLSDAGNRENIKEFLDRAIRYLSPEDRNLPQVLSMSFMVLNGIAVHHGSLLPFVKECVELLFSMNLVKILIATETFAMGVNMPAKCCVFLSLSKIDNGTFRYVSTGEYVQMSGRAGRRGMDSVGTVMIADARMPPLTAIKRIIQGTPFSLTSQFKLSFGLILLSFRSNVEVEELMRKSYREHGSQRGYDKDMKRLLELESYGHMSCDVCGDLSLYLDVIERICSENWKLISRCGVLNEGVEVMLKDNTVGVVERVLGNTVCLKSNGVDDGVIPSRFLKQPFDVRKPTSRSKVDISKLFCVLKDDAPLWHYGTTNVVDILGIKRLESAFEGLNSLRRCNEFVAHYEEAVKRVLIQEEIDAIKLRYSACSLGMIEEYNRRVVFLTRRKFVDPAITLKGRAAAEIRTVNEVLVVEMIFGNEFRETDWQKIVSLLSSMICDEFVEHELGDDLREGYQMMERYFSMLSKDLDELSIPSFTPLNFSMANAVYDWCNGSSLGRIVSKYDVPEGSFVRLVLRLDECCRELVNVCTMIGDKHLEEKLSVASTSMKRDIVFLPSLYL